MTSSASCGWCCNLSNKEMEVRHDTGILSPAQNSPEAAIPGFESTFLTMPDSTVSLAHASAASTSSMEDGEETREEVRSIETPVTCGDSGFSEMDMTSPELDNGRLSSMDVRDDDDDDDDEDDVSSTISDISGVSDLSGLDWKAAGPMGWIQRQIHIGADPRHVLAKIVRDDASLASIPPHTDEFSLWKIVVKLISEIPWRKKLPNVNTLTDVVALIRKSQRILVLTGAGVSVSCGIPDFRSPKGIYARLARDFPDLPDPHAMFDIRYFNRDPRPFFKFAREIYPGQFQPSPCHKFIRALEAHGKLLRNYTQNIDTLEQVAGIKRVVQCHGSFATATCTNCRRQVGAQEIRDDILQQRIPVCSVCVPEGTENALQSIETNYSDLVARGVMKPDIVFFGEGLPQHFHEAMAQDRDQPDLLLIIGSSLKVQPVALIPSSVPASVPQVLINREPLPDCRVDVELLGDADVLVDHLCRALGDDWSELCWRDSPLTQAVTLLPEDTGSAAAVPASAGTKKSPREKLSTHLVKASSSKSCIPCNTSPLPVPECSRKRHASPPIESISPAKRTRKEDRIDSTDSIILSSEPENMEAEPAKLRVGSSNEEVSTSSCSDETEESWRRDAKQIKLRQMSSDSTRDSGIAEPPEDRPLLSISARLPDNSFLFVAPNRYIFPGAEVFPLRTRRRPSVTDSDLSSSASSLSPSLDSIPSSPVACNDLSVSSDQHLLQ